MKRFFLCFFVMTVSSLAYSQTGVQADFTNAGMQVQGKNIIRVRNVQVAGYGNYYVDFQWNPDTATLSPIRADKDVFPSLSVTTKVFTATAQSAPDFNHACIEEFGLLYQQADWAQVKALVGSAPAALQTFLTTVNATSGTPLFITYGSRVANSNYAPYVIVPLGRYSVYASLDSLQGSTYVASPSGAVTGAAVLCAKK